MKPDRYRKSRAMLERAQRVIPLGSQTFSKSRVVYPANAAPLFLTHGKGSHVWDVDGNEYVDFVNGLLPVILGYDDPDVIEAVSSQLKRGVTFSLATELEVELAELMREIIPCAEMVRFGKNGSDATSGAIRVARAHTGRDRVAVCGYHGWQDWYIGATTRNKGVPAAVGALTHKFPYNDLDALRRLLESHRGEFAAVMMEPMNVEEPRPGYLEGVRDLAHEHGALFILDEIITGFRYHLGGAQTLFNVVPDLATFGKSMGNGFPISAVVGRARYMAADGGDFFLQHVRRRNVEPRGEPRHDTQDAARAGACKTECHRRARNRDHSRQYPAARPLRHYYDIGPAELEPDAVQGQPGRFGGGSEVALPAGSHCARHTHRRVAQHLLRPLRRGCSALDSAQNAACALVREALNAGDIAKRLMGPAIQPVFQVR